MKQLTKIEQEIMQEIESAGFAHFEKIGAKSTKRMEARNKLIEKGLVKIILCGHEASRLRGELRVRYWSRIVRRIV